MKEKEPKKLSLLDGWAVGTGAMVGSTVFVATGAMSGMAGSGAAISFLVAAFVTIIIALCYCEVCSAFPRSGGAYIYPKEVYGEKGMLLSFVTGLAFYGGQGLGSAILATTCAFYVDWVIQILFNVTINTKLFAIGCVLFFGLVNMFSTKLGNLIQNISTYLVVFGLLVFMIWGGVKMDWNMIKSNFLPTGISGMLTAAALCWATFGGWSAIPAMASDFKNPQKDVPRSMISSLVTCGVCFAFLVLVMNGLLPGPQLGQEKAPLAAAASVFSSKGALIVAASGIFAAISTLNGLTMSCSRLVYAMGKEGALPAVLGKTRKNGTPWVAMLVTMVAQLLIAATGLVNIVLQMVSFVTAFSWIVTCICMFRMRKERGKYHPTFRCPLFPVTPVVAIALAVFMIMQMEPTALIVGFSWLAISVVLYYVFTKTSLKKYCYVSETLE